MKNLLSEESLLSPKSTFDFFERINSGQRSKRSDGKMWCEECRIWTDGHMYTSGNNWETLCGNEIDGGICEELLDEGTV